MSFRFIGFSILSALVGIIILEVLLCVMCCSCSV